MFKQNDYKIWAVRFFVLIAIYLSLNAFIWIGFTGDILTATSPHSGDYSRVGYITGAGYADKPGYQLPKRHIKNDEYRDQNIDVLTLGDSFSNGCGKPDMYYQDWIATLQDLNVLHVQKLPQKSFVQTLIVLINSGYLKKVKPRAVILEVVERHATQFLSPQLDWNDTRPLADILQSYQNLRYVDQAPPVSFMNVGNFKFLLYSLLYRIKDNAFFSKVYMSTLDSDYFSVKKSNQLIFAFEDIEHLDTETPEKVVAMNANLNTLSEKLSALGIKLYFMPVVDKYNLYSAHLVSPEYPRSRFFERLRPLSKKYALIDTKKILLEEIDRGEKDVYYADDSHWSAKAPRKIFAVTPITGK